MNTNPNVSNFRDRGHYYVNGILMEDMTMAKCRDAEGIPSVTTKIANWQDDGLVFWKIMENIDAAYNCIEPAMKNQVSIEDWRRLVADEFYRVHNEMRMGTLIHDVMNHMWLNTVPLPAFNQIFAGQAAPEIQDLVFSCKAAYAWLLDHRPQGFSEKILFSKEHGISGTADYSGMVDDKHG